MNTPITSIKNFGAATEKKFISIGITCAEDIKEMGINNAYLQLLKSGERAHFIAYYAMAMGLQGRSWNDCKGKEKEELRKVFDDLVEKSRKDPIAAPSGIEAYLDRIGTGLRR